MRGRFSASEKRKGMTCASDATRLSIQNMWAVRVSQIRWLCYLSYCTEERDYGSAGARHKVGDISEALELTDEGERADDVVMRDKVLEWLSNPHKHLDSLTPNQLTTNTSGYAKWLLIFDNADNLDLIKEFLPPSIHLDDLEKPNGKSLFHGGGIDLPPMTTSECALLLQKRMDETSSPTAYEAALKLVEKLGTVPLVISQIATQIRRNQMTIDEYLGRHDDESLLDELNKVKSLPPKEQYRFTVATVWGLEHFPARHWPLSASWLSLTRTVSLRAFWSSRWRRRPRCLI